MLDQAGWLAGWCMRHWHVLLLQSKRQSPIWQKVCRTFNKVVYVVGRQWRPKLDLQVKKAHLYLHCTLRIWPIHDTSLFSWCNNCFNFSTKAKNLHFVFVYIQFELMFGSQKTILFFKKSLWWYIDFENSCLPKHNHQKFYVDSFFLG